MPDVAFSDDGDSGGVDEWKAEVKAGTVTDLFPSSKVRQTTEGTAEVPETSLAHALAENRSNHATDSSTLKYLQESDIISEVSRPFHN